MYNKTHPYYYIQIYNNKMGATVGSLVCSCFGCCFQECARDTRRWLGA